MKVKMLKRETLVKLTKMAMLTALSVVLIMFVHIPIFPATPFLVYDPADIPLLMGAFLFGPGAGLVMAAIASGIQALFFSADGIVGFVMHMISTGALIGAAGLIYARKHTRKGALIGLIAGTLAMCAAMVPTNLLITTNFYGMHYDAVVSLIPFIIAFNLIKAGVNSAVVFVAYKPLQRFLTPVAKREKASDAA